MRGDKDRIKLGIITREDPHNENNLSGLYYNILDSLRRKEIDIICFYPKLRTFNTLLLFFYKAISKSTGKYFDYLTIPLHAKSIAKDISIDIKKSKINLALFINACNLLAHIEKKNIPYVYFSDATHRLMLNYYKFPHNSFSLLEKWHGKNETISIKKADHLLYPSFWAADSAIKDYGCSPQKIDVIRCGSHVPQDKLLLFEDIKELVRQHQDTLKLLFIGSSWERKGGDIALDTVIELNRRGIKSELQICCGDVPKRVNASRFVKNFGFLNRKNPQQSDTFWNLYKDSDIFLLPTRAECFGFVFGEASAFGLPIVATDTGGVSSYVNHKENGVLLSIASSYSDYADEIEKIWRNKALYLKYAENSFYNFTGNLNWDIWATKVKTIFDAMVS